MIFCGMCGKEITQDMKFCPFCGASNVKYAVQNAEEAGEEDATATQVAHENQETNQSTICTETQEANLSANDTEAAETNSLTAETNQAEINQSTTADAYLQTQTQNAATQEATQAPSKKKKSKKPIIVVVIIVVLAALIGAGVYFAGAPQRSYEQGVTELKAGNWKAAEESFAKAGSYENAKDYAELASGLNSGSLDPLFLTFGVSNDELGQYALGVYYTQLAEDETDTSTLAEIYNTAAEYFTQAGVYEDAETKAQECSNLGTFLEAETNYNNGRLREAKEGYESIPEDTSYNEISAKERLSTIKKYSDFYNICGTYTATDGHIENYNYESNDNFKANASDYAQAEILCIIQDDGNVEVRINANYTIYTTNTTSTWATMNINSRLLDVNNEASFKSIDNVYGSYGNKAEDGEIVISKDEITISYYKESSTSSEYYSEASYTLVNDYSTSSIGGGSAA